MVDQKRSAKLKAQHELLPPAPRLRTERPFMDLATERTCIKKKKKRKKTGVIVWLGGMGAGNLLT